MSYHAGDGGGGHQREVSWAQFVGEELGVALRTCPIGDPARRSDRVGDGNRFFLPAISFITDLLRPGDTIRPVITAAGSRPFGCRPARAGTNRRMLRAVLDAPIVIKKHRSSLSGNTVQPHVGVDGLTAPFLHVPRYGG
jgi:hypothetical protein